MTRSARLVLMLTLAALAVSCGRLPSSRFYMVEIRPDGVATVANGRSVGVAAFHVDPPYDQDRIVYRLAEKSPQVAFYPYDRWAAPLSRMLPAAVAGGLQGLAEGASVAVKVPGRTHDAELHGHLVALEEIDLEAGPRIRLELALELLDADGKVAWSGTLRGEQSVAATQVEQIVEAMSRVLAAELERVRPEIAQAVRSLSPSPPSD